MDRAPLEPLLADISDPIQRCLPGDNPGIRLLEGYLGSLFSLEQRLRPHARNTAHP